MRHAPAWIAVVVAVAAGISFALYEHSAEPLTLRAGTALPEPRPLEADLSRGLMRRACEGTPPPAG